MHSRTTSKWLPYGDDTSNNESCHQCEGQLLSVIGLRKYFALLFMIMRYVSHVTYSVYDYRDGI